MEKPLITTIIPTYRRPQLLKKAIQSVLSQNYPYFEVWVCDNASGDETAEVVADFVKKDPRVKYFCHETNIGMLGNYQFGLSLIKTEYFSFLSDDDVLLPNFYDTTLQEFKKHPEAGFVAGSTIIMTEKGKTIRIPLDYWPREGVFDPPEGVKEMIGKYPVPTSVLFRKKAIDHAKIDFDNPTYWDCDYLLQIASRFPIVISKKTCALFRQHELSYSNQQNLDYYEDAFGKLIKNIRENRNLSTQDSESAINLIRFDMAQCRKHYFLYFLMRKQFDEAIKIVRLIGNDPSFKKKAIFYERIALFCKSFPIAFQGLLLLRRIKRLLSTLKNRKNKSYAVQL